MAKVVSDDGLLRDAEILRAAWNADGRKLKLFKNNLTPTRTSVLADFTECDFDGYAPITILGFGAAAMAAHIATTTAAVLTFTKAAGATGNSVYGYYITNTAGTVLYESERDAAAPVSMSVTGYQYLVTLSGNAQNLTGVA